MKAIDADATDTADGPQWSVYIIECSDSTLYTGVTTELERRINEHNDGTGGKYTRHRRPVKLVYSEPASNRSAALKRELAIKRLTTDGKRKLIIADCSGIT
jgi:putative endonuclease